MTAPHFSDAEEARLRTFHAEGRPIPWMSNQLKRSRNGVYKHLIQMKLIVPVAQRAHGPRTDLPWSQTRKVDNATADARFTAAMGGRLFSIMATQDGGKLHMRRPETVIMGGGSSLAFAAGRTVEEAAKP